MTSIKFFNLKKLPLILGAVFLCICSSFVSSQTKNSKESQQKASKEKEKPRMIFLGEFEAGQPNAGIYKLFDPTDEVLCYILMPTTAIRKQVEGNWVYEGNNLGSISCLRFPLPKKQ